MTQLLLLKLVCRMSRWNANPHRRSFISGWRSTIWWVTKCNSCGGTLVVWGLTVHHHLDTAVPYPEVPKHGSSTLSREPEPYQGLSLKQISHHLNNWTWGRTKLELERGCVQMKYMVPSPSGSEAAWLFSRSLQVIRDIVRVLIATLGCGGGIFFL